MIDITAPKVGVQVQVSADGRVLWINVDGICQLRAHDIPVLEVCDQRPARGKQLLKEEEVAEMLNLEPSTLRRWRWKRYGPTFTKLGNSVRYRPKDVKDFIAANRRSSTSDSGRKE